jgi:hypothetical protein
MARSDMKAGEDRVFGCRARGGRTPHPRINHPQPHRIKYRPIQVG